MFYDTHELAQDLSVASYDCYVTEGHLDYLDSRHHYNRFDC